MRQLQSFLGLGLALLLQGPAAQADQLSGQQQSRSDSAPQTAATRVAELNTEPVTSYAARYERYGVLGLYHVSLRIDELRNGVAQQRFHIDGAGRPTKIECNLGVCKLKFRLPPVHLAAYINTRGYKKHFLGLLTSDEFGPTYALNDAQGLKLIVMAHNAMNKMNNSDELLYFTFPFQVGPFQFWTSNSIVASLVRAANQEGIKLPDPADGCYPGFKGPYLSKSHFQ